MTSRRSPIADLGPRLDVLGLRSEQVLENGTLHGPVHVALAQPFQGRKREGRGWRSYLLQA
eukprot:964176-Pyramimonas_sp.AAC.1